MALINPRAVIHTLLDLTNVFLSGCARFRDGIPQQQLPSYGFQRLPVRRCSDADIHPNEDCERLLRWVLSMPSARPASQVIESCVSWPPSVTRPGKINVVRSQHVDRVFQQCLKS